MDDTKERIREILDNLINYQDKELNEKDISELAKMKRELKEIKQSIKKKLTQVQEKDVKDVNISVGDLKSNLTRIELALENISRIISESIIILGSDNSNSDYSNNEYDDIDENEDMKVDNSKSIEEKIDERKKVKDPLEAFFVSYDNANKLIKRIKDELK